MHTCARLCVQVALRFQPTHPAPRIARATLILNNSPLNATHVTLRGAGDVPRLTFSDTPHPSAPGVVVPVGSRAKRWVGGCANERVGVRGCAYGCAGVGFWGCGGVQVGWGCAP